MSIETSHRPDGTGNSDSSRLGAGSLIREEGRTGEPQVAYSVLNSLLGRLFGENEWAQVSIYGVPLELSQLVKGASIGRANGEERYVLYLPNNTGKGPVGRSDKELDLIPRNIPPDADRERKLRDGLENVMRHCARTGIIFCGIWGALPENIQAFVAGKLSEKSGAKKTGDLMLVLRLAAQLHDIGKFLLSSEDENNLYKFYTGARFEEQDRSILDAFLLNHVIEGALALIGDRQTISSLEQLVCVFAALLHHRIHPRAPYPEPSDIRTKFSAISIAGSLAAQGDISDFPNFTETVIGYIEQIKSKSQDDFGVTVNELIKQEGGNKLALAVSIICIVMNAVDIFDARLFDSRQYQQDRKPSCDSVLQDMREANVPNNLCDILRQRYPSLSSLVSSV